MARGWESKAVEDQMQDSQSRAPGDPRTKLTPEQVETSRQREVLILAITNVQRHLQAVSDPQYRAQLERALESLETRLAQQQQKP
jgi:hypothetical protein